MISHKLIIKLQKLFNKEILLTNYENMPVTFTCFDSAKEANINFLLKEFNSKLPKDYIEFLKFFDGCTIFNFNDLGGYKFLSSSEIVKGNLEQKESYKEMWDENIIVFCEEHGSGDFISFRNRDDGSYDILDCCHDDFPKDWSIICNSLNEFLEKLIDLNGKAYWLFDNKN